MYNLILLMIHVILATCCYAKLFIQNIETVTKISYYQKYKIMKIKLEILHKKYTITKKKKIIIIMQSHNSFSEL